MHGVPVVEDGPGCHRIREHDPGDRPGNNRARDIDGRLPLPRFTERIIGAELAPMFGPVFPLVRPVDGMAVGGASRVMRVAAGVVIAAPSDSCHRQQDGRSRRERRLRNQSADAFRFHRCSSALWLLPLRPSDGRSMACIVIVVDATLTEARAIARRVRAS